MITTLLIRAFQQDVDPRLKVTQADRSMVAVCEKAFKATFPGNTNSIPWRRSATDESRSFYNRACKIYLSETEPVRILLLSTGSRQERMNNGPGQTSLFNSLAQWEPYAFKKVAAVWPDVDGFVISYDSRGEIATKTKHPVTGQTIQQWASDSNIVGMSWRTHSIRGFQRDFSATLDRATGEVLSLACGPFHPISGVFPAKIDNSKKRGTKVVGPPPSLTLESYAKWKKDRQQRKPPTP